MKIWIKSRKEIEALSKFPFPEHTALISITDAHCSFAPLTYQPEFLLQIAFDDVDNDVIIDQLGYNPTEDSRKAIEAKYKMISDLQATQIADFYRSKKESFSTLICQCEHGQSRSAAVAAAILEYRSRKGIKIFAHDHYCPNKVVFRKVLQALQVEHQNDVV